MTWLLVLAVFLCTSFTSAPVPGVNEPHYLCRARSFYDPDWCSADFFLQSLPAHSVFYVLTGGLVSTFSFAAVAVAGRMVSLAIVAFGWCRLCARMQLGDHATCCAAVLLTLLFMSGSFSGEWLIGGFESKVPAWGFALLAISQWLSGSVAGSSLRQLMAVGLFAGLATALHPVVGGWLTTGLIIAESLELLCYRFVQVPVPLKAAPRRSAAVLRAIVGWGIMLTVTVIVALPGLIPALRVLRDSQLEPDAQRLADLIQVFVRLKHHLDPTAFPVRAWCYAGVLLVAYATLRVVMRRLDPALISIPRRLDCLLAAAVLIAIGGIVIGWHTHPIQSVADWSWRVPLMKFYPFRFFDLLLPIATALCAGAVVAGGVRRVANRWNRSVTPADSRVMAVTGLLIASCAGVLNAARPPSGYTDVEFSDWTAACEWIQEHVPADAVVVTPRESFAFKWYAERPEYVCYKDCPQDSAGILEWNERLRVVLYRWSWLAEADGFVTSAELQQLASSTQARCWVTRRTISLQVAPAWQNRSWQVVQLPPVPLQAGTK